MVQVRWELEGGGIDEIAAEAAVEPIINYYKRALVGVTCPTHGSGPWLAGRGRTVEGLMVSVGACCPVLRVKADERIRSVSRRNED